MKILAGLKEKYFISFLGINNIKIKYSLQKEVLKRDVETSEGHGTSTYMS